MVDQDKIIRELLLRKQAKNSIVSYMEYMQSTGLVPFHYMPAEHHLLMIEKFEQMYPPMDEEGKGVLNPSEELRRLAIALPPGSAKSSYVSIILVTWLLARNPRLLILCVTNTESLSEDFSRTRRQIFNTREWQQLAGTELKADSQSLQLQKFPEGGGVYSCGQGSTITGIRSDLNIYDDLVKGIEQTSVGALQKITSWEENNADTRLKPGGKTLICSTRWSRFDPTGVALELHNKGIQQWDYLRIPYECDSEDDPLGRKIGDPLWTDWFNQSEINERKRNPVLWMALYQQTPLSDSGEWCRSESIVVIPDVPEILNYYIGVDLALTSGAGDFTCFILAGIDKDKNIYFIDMYHKQVSVDVSAETLLAWIKEYKPSTVFVDQDNASKVWSKLVWERARARGVSVPLMLVPHRGRDKTARAAPLQDYLAQGRVLIKQAPWNRDMVDQFQAYPSVLHDDIVDAAGLVCSQVIKLTAPKENVKPSEQKIECQLGMVGGQMMINSTLDDMFQDLKDSKRKHHFQRGRI